MVHIVCMVNSRRMEVSSDGTEEGTIFSGSSADIRKATAVARRGLYVPVGIGRLGGVEPVQAGFDSPMGLMAAMASIAPANVYVITAPKDVMEHMYHVQRGDLFIRKGT